MADTIITLLYTVLFFGTAYVYGILFKCLDLSTRAFMDPDSVTRFITDRQKKHLLFAYLLMIACILVCFVCKELSLGGGFFGGLLFGLFVSLAFSAVNPFALVFYALFLYLLYQEKKFLSLKHRTTPTACEMYFERYGKEGKLGPFVCFCLCVLCAALSLFFAVREDDLHYLLYFGLMPIAYFGFLALLLLSRSDGGHVLDMIRIDAEGIKLESWKGRDICIPYDYIYQFKKYFGGRSPTIMHVKSITGEQITWFVTDLKPELFILELHPELKLIFERR